ncbi:hypothetical protein DB345_14455 [Spartobacteria bacterium LR76]|nr:hypothetical protein DB345_14455 [Spartobacteria bacterium LR76]
MSENDDLTRKLEEISRELFINRCLLVFIAVCAGIILFLPRVALAIAETGDSIIQGISPWASSLFSVIIGLGIVFAVGAYIVARIAPKAPGSEEIRK